MKLYKLITPLFLVLTFLFVYTTSGVSQDIVRVDAENAEIHEKHESTDSYFVLAQKGDLFELASFENGWIGIQIFSGEVRYLNIDDVYIERDFLSEKVDFSSKIELCQDVQTIVDQATLQADSKYPEDQKSAEAYKNVLIANPLFEDARSLGAKTWHVSYHLNA